ncbi:hypothetical protein DL98DRAFT_530805 [Cadophora sp. DSE1049]|nr:hypothetical protein DL98DRAFT_530805 [Cadophora sp. DSE1049]
MLCCVVLCCAVLCCVVLCCAVLCCAVLGEGFILLFLFLEASAGRREAGGKEDAVRRGKQFGMLLSNCEGVEKGGWGGCRDRETRDGCTRTGKVGRMPTQLGLG